MAKKKEVKKEELPKVHKDLEGFDISINTFGNRSCADRERQC